MFALKRYRNKGPGLPDLLTYAAVVDDGVVLNKDGSLLAGWYYRGADIASSTDPERNNVSAKVNAALTRLGSGWISHQDAVRIHSMDYPPPEDCHFPDPITRMIDNERRAQFEAEGGHYESIHFLTVTYLPPLARDKRLADLMFEDDSQIPKQKSSGLANKILDDFKGALVELEDALSAALTLQRMTCRLYTDEFGQRHTRDQLLQYLHYCLTGNNHPINLPPCAMYIDSIIGGHDFWGGVTPKVNDKFITIVALEGFPEESYPGILAALDQIGGQYRWSTRFIYLDTIEAINHLRAYRRQWQQKVRGFTDQIFRSSRQAVNQDAADMVFDTEIALAEAASNLVVYGYYTSVIVLMDDNRETLGENAREIRRIIQNLGFSCRIETINAIEAWLGSLPGHGVQNVRRPLMNTMNLADLLPLASVWPGREHNSCPFYPPKSPPLLYAATEGATPFRLNLHIGDTGHTLIFGPTGAGKSTLLATIAAQFRRYPNATIFAFDKGRSMLPLTLAAGGDHYEIAGESDALHFCPLAHIDTDSEQAWAEEWIATLVQLQGIRVRPKERNEIHRAMSLLRESKVPGSRTLTDFAATLQDPALRETLAPYLIGGTLGYLLDSEQDSLELGSYQCFEIEELMNLGDKNLIPVLLYLFQRLEHRLQGQPALLLLDEAWVMLGHSVFRDKIREWLKVLRKANCAVVLATQSLSDAARSGILDVLVESCPTKIFLPNVSAMESESRKYYEAMGLHERQLELITTAIPKRQYYYVSPEGRRVFDLNLGPVALSFVGASGKHDLREVKRLRTQHQNQWPYQWLEQRGITYAPFDY
jgi:type IV secretion system protein VirB4